MKFTDLEKIQERRVSFEKYTNKSLCLLQYVKEWKNQQINIYRDQPLPPLPPELLPEEPREPPPPPPPPDDPPKL